MPQQWPEQQSSRNGANDGAKGRGEQGGARGASSRGSRPAEGKQASPRVTRGGKNTAASTKQESVRKAGGGAGTAGREPSGPRARAEASSAGSAGKQRRRGIGARAGLTFHCGGRPNAARGGEREPERGPKGVPKAVDITRLASATHRVSPCTGSGRRGGSGRKPVPQGQAPRRARARREGGEGDRRQRTEGNEEEAGGRVDTPVHIWPRASLCATSQGGGAPCAGRFGIPARGGEARQRRRRGERGGEGGGARERASRGQRRERESKGGGGARREEDRETREERGERGERRERERRRGAGSERRGRGGGGGGREEAEGTEETAEL